MREVSALELKKKNKISAKTIFLVSMMVLLFSPFAAVSSMIGMVGDTCIQIKIGLDDIAQGKLITDEIYSWHEGLVFTAHESGWYLLLGLMYKAMKLWGVITVGMVFIYATGFTAVNYFKDKAHPLIAAAVMAVTPFLNGYPDYNVRPSVTSIFAVTLLVVTFLSERKPVVKASVFATCCFFLGWLQGGILPLFCAVYAVYIVIELLFRNFRDSGVLAIGLAAGFVVSLLNPMGFRNYTFGLKQSAATDIWAVVDEWNPMHFSILQMVLILLVFVGFMTNDSLRRFEKQAVIKIAYLSMFLILTCVYKRFVSYYSIAFLLFGPEQFESLLKWFSANVIKPKREIALDLSEGFYKILTGVCAVMLIGLGALYIPKYLPTGTMADVEGMAAYDYGAVEFVKTEGYSKVFNTFDTGSWLAFYDVKVHIDNRIDPFMSEFSGEDHIRGQMGVDSVSDLDAFRARYDNDAFIVNMGEGYSFLVDDIENNASDRYRVVYDNTVESTIPGVAGSRWIVIECI